MKFNLAPATNAWEPHGSPRSQHCQPSLRAAWPHGRPGTLQNRRRPIEDPWEFHISALTPMPAPDKTHGPSFSTFGSPVGDPWKDQGNTTIPRDSIVGPKLETHGNATDTSGFQRASTANPWKPHGRPMGAPWATRGPALGVPREYFRDSYRRPVAWDFHGPP